MSTRDTGTVQAPERATAYVVYGIVPGDVTPTDDARGLGDPSAAVTTVTYDRVGALVSEVPAGSPLGRPQDLVAYQRLLDGASRTAPVLPMRFGAALADRESVARLLADNHDAFLVALNEVDERSEFIVRGRYVEQALLERILAEVPEAARLRDSVRGRPEESTMNERIQLGEIVNQAVEAMRAMDARELVAALEPLTVARAERQPTHEQDAVHLAVLVDDGRRSAFERAVEEVAQRWRGRVHVRLLGPVAPYDFVTVPGAA